LRPEPREVEALDRRESLRLRVGAGEEPVGDPRHVRRRRHRRGRREATLRVDLLEDLRAILPAGQRRAPQEEEGEARAVDALVPVPVRSLLREEMLRALVVPVVRADLLPSGESAPALDRPQPGVLPGRRPGVLAEGRPRGVEARLEPGLGLPRAILLL